MLETYFTQKFHFSSEIQVIEVFCFSNCRCYLIPFPQKLFQKEACTFLCQNERHVYMNTWLIHEEMEALSDSQTHQWRINEKGTCQKRYHYLVVLSYGMPEDTKFKVIWIRFWLSPYAIRLTFYSVRNLRVSPILLSFPVSWLEPCPTNFKACR